MLALVGSYLYFFLLIPCELWLIRSGSQATSVDSLVRYRAGPFEGHRSMQLSTGASFVSLAMRGAFVSVSLLEQNDLCASVVGTFHPV
jgi:hypothetical protein